MKGKKTGGRVKGVPNKATRELKELARSHGPTLMKELVRLALSAESEAARVSAIKEAFDRGWGKAAQPVTGDDGGPVSVAFTFAIDKASRADEDGDD